jgi:hypothetical protein
MNFIVDNNDGVFDVNAPPFFPPHIKILLRKEKGILVKQGIM